MCKTHKGISLPTHREEFESAVHLRTLSGMQPNEMSPKLGLMKPTCLAASNPLCLASGLDDSMYS